MVSGRPISGLRPSEVARLGVGYVPQRANVFPSLTVAENLEIGLSAAPHKSLPRRLEAMYGLFPRLAERRRQTVGAMSGGERQMVAIARALMPEPSALLLDEPSAGLAPMLVDGVFAQSERHQSRRDRHPHGRTECAGCARALAPRLCA